MSMTAPKSRIVKSIENRLEVAFLPTLVRPGMLEGRTAVVTDILRATSTIVNALANGCHQVLPQPTIEAARETHQAIENSVLGGERGGRIVAGFHHGNSPIEYSPEAIAGKTLVLATTNGTVAMEHCRSARRVLIGAMINLSAVAERIDENEKVTIVCSGTDGFVTNEDVMFAGALIDTLIQRSSFDSIEQAMACEVDGFRTLGDMARIAVNHWRNTCAMMEQGSSLADFFRTARGGINLARIGLEEDIVFASQVDTVPVVPELCLEEWSIRLRTD
jgi:2-phosphosulfolactate phosphatase